MYEQISWCDRKHYTVIDPQIYDIFEDILTVEKGIFYKKINSIPLYNLKDVKLTRSTVQRMCGLCTIRLIPRDNSENDIILENIWYDYEFYNTLVSVIHYLYREMVMHHYIRPDFLNYGYAN